MVSPDLPARQRVFDAHVDSLQLALDLGRDLSQEGVGHLDLERGRRGGLGSVVLVCWTDPAYLERGEARTRTQALLREFHGLVERCPERIRFAGNGAMLREAHAAGALAGIPGIEGGHAIEESLDHLKEFFDQGVRVMTLVWNNHLSWIRSCRDGAGPEVPAGLSDFGREVVTTMNELGMLIDLSHAGERAFHDTLEVSAQPVIASHSGCMALNDHPRNLTDDQLRSLRDTGGVAGIVFCTPFLDAVAMAEERALRQTEGYRALTASNDTELHWLQGQYLQERLPPFPIDRVVDHVLHAIDVAGVEHVGIGSDYDGIQRTPAGLEHAGCYGRLAAALEARGLRGDELDAVLGGNMERVFTQATAVCAKT